MEPRSLGVRMRFGLPDVQEVNYRETPDLEAIGYQAAMATSPVFLGAQDRCASLRG